MKESSMDAAVAAVMSALEGILALKEEQGTEQEAFLCGKDVFTLLPSRFWFGFSTKQTGHTEGCDTHLVPLWM